MAKIMKLEDLKAHFEEKSVLERLVKPIKRTIHFKRGLKFITKNGRISGVYPGHFKGRNIFKEVFGKREEEVVTLNAQILGLKQVQFLGTIIQGSLTLRINRNDAVYDVNDEELFHFIVGQPASKALETVDMMDFSDNLPELIHD